MSKKERSRREFAYTDNDEKELIESIEATRPEDLRPASPDYRSELQRAAQEHVAAEQTRMNIRIDRADLDRIKERAALEGLKYQSLVKSVLHKYVTGQLVESDER